MEFNGTFELEDATSEEVWSALSNPVLVKESLPGCEYLVHVDDDDVDFDALSEQHANREDESTSSADVQSGTGEGSDSERSFEEGEQYAALVQISVGPVNPTFETVVTIDRYDYPEMAASGEGSSGDSSFEMSSSMELSETDTGVLVEWETEADVFGRVAQMGQRVVNPVANRIVKRFFSSVQEQMNNQSVSDETATTGEGSQEETGDESADDSTGRTGESPAEGQGDEEVAEEETQNGETDNRSFIGRLLGRSKK